MAVSPWEQAGEVLGWIVLALIWIVAVVGGAIIAAIILYAIYVVVKSGIKAAKQRLEIRELHKRYYVKQKDRPKSMEEFEEKNWGIDEVGEDEKGIFMRGRKRPE